MKYPLRSHLSQSDNFSTKTNLLYKLYFIWVFGLHLFQSNNSFVAYINRDENNNFLQYNWYNVTRLQLHLKFSKYSNSNLMLYENPMIRSVLSLLRHSYNPRKRLTQLVFLLNMCLLTTQPNSFTPQTTIFTLNVSMGSLNHQAAWHSSAVLFYKLLYISLLTVLLLL